MPGSTRPIDIAQGLIERKADVNAKSTTGMTALMIAAAHNNPPMIGLLIESGADPHAKNNQDQTASDVAQLNGNLEAAQAIKVLATAKAASATPRRPASPRARANNAHQCSRAILRLCGSHGRSPWLFAVRCRCSLPPRTSPRPT